MPATENMVQVEPGAALENIAEEEVEELPINAAPSGLDETISPAPVPGGASLPAPTSEPQPVETAPSTEVTTPPNNLQPEELGVIGEGPYTESLLSSPTIDGTCNDCSANCFSCLCCGYEPWELTQFYGSTRSLVLWRTRPDNRTLVADATTGAALIVTDDLELSDAKYGQEGTFGLRYDSANSIEISGYWLDDGTGMQEISSPNLAVPFFGPGSAPFGTLSSVEARGNSSLWNTEFNYIRSLRDGTDSPYRVRLLAGTRFIQFDERLSLAMQGTGFTANYDGRIENFMIGGQVGAMATYPNLLPKLDIDVWGKLGLFGNSVWNHQNLSTSTAGVLQNNSLKTQRFSQSLEASIEAVYKVRPGAQIVLGYRALFLNYVGRGSDQLDYNLNTFAPGTDSNDSIWYHGITAGVRLYWGARTDPCCHSGCCTPYVVKSACYKDPAWLKCLRP